MMMIRRRREPLSDRLEAQQPIPIDLRPGGEQRKSWRGVYPIKLLNDAKPVAGRRSTPDTAGNGGERFDIDVRLLHYQHHTGLLPSEPLLVVHRLRLGAVCDLNHRHVPHAVQAPLGLLQVDQQQTPPTARAEPQKRAALVVGSGQYVSVLLDVAVVPGRSDNFREDNFKSGSLHFRSHFSFYLL